MSRDKKNLGEISSILSGVGRVLRDIVSSKAFDPKLGLDTLLRKFEINEKVSSRLKTSIKSFKYWHPLVIIQANNRGLERRIY